jgi:hypothetical protein
MGNASIEGNFRQPCRNTTEATNMVRTKLLAASVLALGLAMGCGDDTDSDSGTAVGGAAGAVGSSPVLDAGPTTSDPEDDSPGLADENGDGTPDLMEDADGDGIPDAFVDTDGDGAPDLLE